MKKLIFIALLLICIQPNVKSQFYYGCNVKDIYNELSRNPNNLNVEIYQGDDGTMVIKATSRSFITTYLFNKANICYGYVAATLLKHKDAVYDILNTLYIRTDTNEWEDSNIYVSTMEADGVLYIFEFWKQ
ncbi:MAG TPA: hypothetical protein PLM63_03740 [bacterium]|jgi:hypothetical protein|nr:MAG: hypothetical protein BWX61_01148 [Bacteroidetes bacterium ADurb.Bin035]HPO11670.1 hypothetical protein [bacterium]